MTEPSALTAVADHGSVPAYVCAVQLPPSRCVQTYPLPSTASIVDPSRLTDTEVQLPVPGVGVCADHETPLSVET